MDKSDVITMRDPISGESLTVEFEGEFYRVTNTVPRYRGRIPDVPQTVGKPLKFRQSWCAMDLMRQHVNSKCWNEWPKVYRAQHA